MNYKHDFNEVCSQVPFTTLLAFLNIPFERDGKTLKTEDIIVTENKASLGGFTFDIFKWKDQKAGGSIIDYAQSKLNLKSKIKTVEYLKSYVLGQKEQSSNIPELTLYYDPFLEKCGISEDIAKGYHVGLVKGKSVMTGRIAFKLFDKDNNHRGYIGLDHLYKKKIKWYIPEGTKVSDVIFNYNRKNGNDYCLIVPTVLEALYLCSLGFTYTLGMVTPGITREQEEMMKVFKRIIVIGAVPEGIARRLYNNSFIKVIENTIMDKTAEQIRQMF